MNKKYIFTAFLALILTAVLLLAACGSEQTNEIEGTYESAGTVYTFANDGTMSLEKDGTTSYGWFTADNGALTLYMNGDITKYTYTYESGKLSLFRPGMLLGTEYTKTADAADSIDGWDGPAWADVIKADTAETAVSETSSEPEAATEISTSSPEETTKAPETVKETETTKSAETIAEAQTSQAETESQKTTSNEQQTVAINDTSTDNPSGQGNSSQQEQPATPNNNTDSPVPLETTGDQNQGQNDTRTTNTPTSTYKLTGDFYPGAIVTFGSYEQDNNTSNGSEPIEWIVLSVNDGRAFLMSRYGLDCQPYDANWGTSTWDTCTLRTWLNDTFLNTAFTQDEQSIINITNVTPDANGDYDTYAGNACEDRIFLLSTAQAYIYFDNYSERAITPTEYAIANGAQYDYSAGGYWWWLRTPGRSSDYAALISPSGTIDYVGYYTGDSVNAVRPVMWVSID